MVTTHTSTHTRNSVSHVLALSHARSEQDRARSNWVGLTLDGKPIERERQVLYSSFWLCAFATLAYWILGFLLSGPFFPFFFGLPGSARRWVHFEDWWSCIMKERKDWKMNNDWRQTCHSLSPYTQLMDRVYKDVHLQFELFLPQRRATNSCCGFDGRTGQHHLYTPGSFHRSHIIEHISHRCFFVRQCQILSFGHWRF